MVLLLLALLFQIVAARDRYIVGGGPVTDQDRWKWQGALKADGTYVCGCVLVHESWVITAAQCLSGNSYTVEFGMLEIGGGNEFDIQNAVRHPSYDGMLVPGRLPNDIAVLRSNLISGAFIAPVDLTEGEPLITNSYCWVTGWGSIDASGNFPITLQEVNIQVEANVQCGLLLGDDYNGDVHICAYDPNTQSKGHCNGDQGGPLVCWQETLWRLEGIASWFPDNCNTTVPSVYTRVTEMRNFLCDATSGVVAPGYCTTPPPP